MEQGVGHVSTRPAHAPSTSLAEIVAWLTHSGRSAQVVGDEQTHIAGLTLSSQRVRAGDLYASLPGARVHGIDFAASAIASGAVAVLTDPAGALRAPADVPVVVVDEPRSVLGELAALIYDEPARAMRMIGVTGTQGKTTTTRLAEAGLQGTGVRAAVIGTVGTRVAGTDVTTSLTTPEAPDLHGLFAVMREHAVEACVMEVSSHALVMGRVDGVVFDVAVFLNLGRDHLDFHTDVEDYYRAKASLFTPERARLALVNIDDEHGRRLARETTIPVRTFSTRGADADWTAHSVTAEDGGSRFAVSGPGYGPTSTQLVRAHVPLPGAFNVENALAAIAACAEAGYAAGHVAESLENAVVPGRMEPVVAGQDFVVVVDYAHKPDAVDAAISALRPLADAANGRVIVVLGAGGDRDPGKRPIMGEIAARLADVLIVTDDNPRTEEPTAIRAAVLAGASDVGQTEVHETGDRGAAIEQALSMAAPGDVVLIAGKGHESGQEIDGVVHLFDDRDVARAILSTLASDR
ncbi:MAG: UDP-N-acetylmuramoyl-L-alanyl-D-glutamate--2,6-diaminopimelate ligase [Nocardioides sp.]